MLFTTEKNKEVVLRFNREVIEQGNMDSFHELVSPDVINHAAPEGMPNGADSMIHFLMHVLRVGFPDIKAEILDQVAEGDRVTTRKVLHATHTGEFMGIPPSKKKVAIQVIDIIRLHQGRYAEHWGISNIPDIIRSISE
jgi:predicted ester cyclase